MIHKSLVSSSSHPTICILRFQYIQYIIGNYSCRGGVWGRGKNLELSFLHIGTNTYTRVLCAIKTVPSVLKHPILGRLPLKEISSKYKKLRWCGNEHENSEAFLTKHGSAWQNSISGKNVCKSRPIIFFCGGGTYKL